MISPGIGSTAGERLGNIYRDAELRILELIAASLAEGIEAPGWAQLQLARLQLVRQQILAVLAEVNPAAGAAIAAELAAAYERGGLSALADASATLNPTVAATLAQQAAVASLAAETTAAMAEAQTGILRAVDDIYRRVVADASAQVLTGSMRRRDAVQQVVGRLLANGLPGVPTKRGTMTLPNYAEMATRTAVARSALRGHEATMDDLGLDLVIIHPGPRACKICDRWARMILARRGPTGTITVTDERTGRQMTVHVAATLDEARRAGWGHPNCRCGMASYIPGVTNPDEIERPRWDQKGYEAQQQQRAIERQIRGWKQREAIAMTPEAKADAHARVRSWQQAQRDHLARHPSLKRQSGREQIGKPLR